MNTTQVKISSESPILATLILGEDWEEEPEGEDVESGNEKMSGWSTFLFTFSDKILFRRRRDG